MENDAMLKSQAACGVKVTRRGVRTFLEKASTEWQALCQDVGREVVLSATDQQRVLGFEAAMKALYDSAKDQ